MIRAEQIPDEARQAAANKWFDGAKWEEIVAAALSAWPGRTLAAYAFQTCHILPLPQEKSDE